jgi:DNA polymerase-3 subunit delta'
MPFDRILGQPAAVRTLKRALATGRVHHAYRFEGPDGVGKELAAFAFAQGLVCETGPVRGDAFSQGCGKCSACTRAVTFADQSPRVPLHPDVIVIERGLYPPEAIRRQRPELSEISVDQIRRLVLERSSYAPHEGRARVFIVRRADELSISAANALLKTLEEPGTSTYFLLLTSRGRDLLDTIRSRTQLIRFAPLPSEVVTGILQRAGVAAERIPMAVELASGSASLALDLADPDAYAKRKAFIEAVDTAVRAPDLGSAMTLSDGRDRDKDVLGDRLAALSAFFAQTAREALLREDGGSPIALRAAHQHEIVAEAMLELERNGNPALVLESMVVRMRSIV